MTSPHHLVIMAYARLFALPECTDGLKLTTIVRIGDYDVRLAEWPGSPAGVETLWVELFDRRTGKVVDSAGCEELEKAGFVAEEFLAEAKSRHAAEMSVFQ